MNTLSCTTASSPDAPATRIAQPVTAPSRSLYIKRGTPQLIQLTLALFSAGLATFALLYCVQPILPVLSADFGVSPAASSLSLLVSTGTMALGLLFTGPLSDAVGRKSVMVVSLILAASFTLLSVFMTSWQAILLTRACIGLSLSGVAAVAMTYLSEEIHPSVVAFSMGLYISGNSIGGMSGRLLSGVMTDLFSWRIAVGCIGLMALLAALMFWRILPASRHFRPTSLKPRNLAINFRLHWRDKGLPLLFIEGFLLMGSFVTLFNYIGYRLLSPPWLLSQAVVGLLSVVYLTGSWSSPKAGALTARYGRGPIMMVAILIMVAGLLLTLLAQLVAIFIGMMLFAGGFFAAHSVASSWIGRRTRRAKGQASSLYLFCYYLGSSTAGTLGGLFWHGYGWAGSWPLLPCSCWLAFTSPNACAGCRNCARYNAERLKPFGGANAAAADGAGFLCFHHAAYLAFLPLASSRCWRQGRGEARRCAVALVFPPFVMRFRPCCDSWT